MGRYRQRSVKLVAIMRGRLTLDSAEHSIELRKRLEAGGVGRFTYTEVAIEQLPLHGLDADPGNVLGVCQSGGPLENFAKIERAGVDRLGHNAHSHRFAVVLGNVGPRPDDDRRLGRRLLDHHSVAQGREVLRKNIEEIYYRIVLRLGHDAGAEIG